MEKTLNYEFNTYADDDLLSIDVETWRNLLDGTEPDSFMNKLDALLKDIEDKSIEVIEKATFNELPETGEVGKIYIVYADPDATKNAQYRWTGSEYANIAQQMNYATEEEAVAGIDDTKVMTPAKTKLTIESLGSGIKCVTKEEYEALESAGEIDENSVYGVFNDPDYEALNVKISDELAAKLNIVDTTKKTVEDAIDILTDKTPTLPENLLLIEEVNETVEGEYCPLDASLLNGHPSDYFGTKEDITQVSNNLTELTDRGYLSNKELTIVDCNSLLSGNYMVDGNTALNVPVTSNSWYYLQSYSSNNGAYNLQFATDEGNGKTWRRTLIGSWTEWQEIATMDKINKLIVNAPINLYVDASIGNDVTGDGSQAKPFKSITKALNTLPLGAINRNDRNTMIFIAGGVYDEVVYIYNKYDIIQFVLQGNVTIKSIYMKNAKAIFVSDNMQEQRTLNINPVNNHAAISANDCTFLELRYNIKMVCDGSNTTASHFIECGSKSSIISTWAPLVDSGIYIYNLKENTSGLSVSFGEMKSYNPVRGNNNAGTLVSSMCGIIQMPSLEATTSGIRVYKAHGGLALGGAGVDLT